ncbi:hypothetical protein [Methylobacterium sp. E-046]|uniref:hypothetical protein n=1 Tax=Methylobacterium sp. E-046 TaxID=2836576 RepID=UPI001FB8D7B7|nr:hypothetical protein [Methylobacterium sp. E-046]MCJ2101833.1 hypothetical protein [Methylobacterium sp. E-046]
MQPDTFEAVWDLLVAIVTDEARADDAALFAVDAEAIGDVAGAHSLRRVTRAWRVAAMEKRGQLGALLAPRSGAIDG